MLKEIKFKKLKESIQNIQVNQNCDQSRELVLTVKHEAELYYHN